METTRASKALQQIASELSQSQYGSISTAGKDTWTFDFDGNPTTTAADVYLTVKRSAVANITLPGASDASPSLIRVCFEVSFRGSQNFTATNSISVSDCGY